MNKEEDYRNLAGNITAFTDNTCYYEDWLVIQQYVDDWLDEIDQLTNNWNELEEWLKEDLKQIYRDAGYRNNIVREILDKMKEIKERNNDKNQV